MKALKAFAVGLLSFLLFLSLSVFGLIFTINQTVLNPSFVVAEVNKLDIAGLAEEVISEQVPGNGQLVDKVIRDTVDELEPWIREQVRTITFATLDYLRGNSQSLSLVINLQPLQTSIRDNLRQAVLESPPPELVGASPAEIEQFINLTYQEITQNIPASYELSLSAAPADVQSGLVQARQIVSYFELAYWGLIAFMVLLVLGIILIKRNVRSTTRVLGIVFLICGVVEYAAIYLINLFLEPGLVTADLPAALQTWLPQLMADVWNPLKMFSIGMAAAGVVLIVVSFVYKPRPTKGGA